MTPISDISKGQTHRRDWNSN